MDQRPKDYPKASDLVNSLMEDVRLVFGAMFDERAKHLKEKFHVTVRRHRHEQERFGKKWKRAREELKDGVRIARPSRHWPATQSK